MCKERCPNCKRVRPLTEHHVIPRRLLKGMGRDTTHLNRMTTLICRECHDELERLIAIGEKEILFTEHFNFYVSMAYAFAGG